MPQFEKFSRRAKRSTRQPTVTLQSRGSFSLNLAAYEVLGEPSFVAILYDSKEHIVGLQVADDGDPDAYQVRKQQAGNSFIIAAQAFVKYYDIPINESQRCKAEMMGDILVFKLDQSAVPSED